MPQITTLIIYNPSMWVPGPTLPGHSDSSKVSSSHGVAFSTFEKLLGFLEHIIKIAHIRSNLE